MGERSPWLCRSGCGPDAPEQPVIAVLCAAAFSMELASHGGDVTVLLKPHIEHLPIFRRQLPADGVNPLEREAFLAVRFGPAPDCLGEATRSALAGAIIHVVMPSWRPLARVHPVHLLRAESVIGVGRKVSYARGQLEAATRGSGLSQAGLAHKANLSKRNIQNWEQGQREPDLQRLRLIAGILGVTLDELTADPETVKASNRKAGGK